MLIDTHCHLNFKAFEGKVEKAIQRAKKSGVKKIIVPGTNLETSKRAVELTQKYDEIYAAVGIHPHHSKLKTQSSKLKAKLEKLVKSKKVVAIGECGLDYFQVKNLKFKEQSHSSKLKIKKIQKEIFELQIELAKKLNLPLIIHNRQASKDILKTINNAGVKAEHPRSKHRDQQLAISNLRAVFHCFQGSNQLLSWALKNNFYIGITGIVTYNKKMQEIVRKTPLKNILIETDAPFLTPEPIRKTKKWPNEPKNVKIVAERVVKIKGDSFLNIARKTSKNAIQLFKL